MSAPLLSPARAAGPLAFTSGQLARDGDGSIVPGGIEAQAERALANLVRVLADERLRLRADLPDDTASQAEDPQTLSVHLPVVACPHHPQLR